MLRDSAFSRCIISRHLALDLGRTHVACGRVRPNIELNPIFCSQPTLRTAGRRVVPFGTPWSIWLKCSKEGPGGEAPAAVFLVTALVVFLLHPDRLV